MPLPAGSRLGPYEILAPLGAGGMGEVYRARDPRLGREVAVKVLPRDRLSDEGRRRRFLQEARAASTLNHPSIVTIHEIESDAGTDFIVMELVRGRSLAELVAAQGMAIADVLRLAIPIADALARAHQAGIVHRDLKPANVVVSDDGVPKILDFGLAKLMQPEPGADDSTEETAAGPLSQTGAILGTPAYMSPEQASGRKVDARSDVFSFGSVLYEMVTGRRAFAGGSFQETLFAVVSAEPSPASAVKAGVPPALESLIQRCLRKDPNRRFQQMAEVKVALEDLREESTSGAGRPRTAGAAPVWRASAWRRLAGVVTVALVVAGSAYWLLGRRAPADANPGVETLVVLPLKALGRSTDDADLGLGIANEIITRTSQVAALTVRPLSAVRKYADQELSALEAGQQLQGDAVLEGSLQKAGGRLRVSVNLLRVSDGASLWAENFDLGESDIFAIQDSVSKQVVAKLKLRLSPAETARLDKRYTASPEAYAYYLKGRLSLERVTTSIGAVEAPKAAIGYLEKAVEQDPSYALAHAQLAGAFMWMANFNDPDDPAWVERYRRALARAEAADPQLAEIHAVRFQHYFSRHGGWDLVSAAREIRRSLALNPSIGHVELNTIYDHLGLDEATGLRALERAREIDPTNPSLQHRLVESLALYLRFAEAIDQHRRFFDELGPARALLFQGRLQEAIAQLEARVAGRPGDIVARSELALGLALSGRSAEAEGLIPAILAQAQNNRAYHHVTYNIASVYALAGKAEEAVRWMRTTAETGFPNHPSFARDPHFDRIRADPAFVRFMAELQSRWEGYRREIEAG